MDALELNWSLDQRGMLGNDQELLGRRNGDQRAEKSNMRSNLIHLRSQVCLCDRRLGRRLPSRFCRAKKIHQLLKKETCEVGQKESKWQHTSLKNLVTRLW